MTASPILVGCDFSSSPTQRKPIVVAVGHAKAGRVQLQSLLRFDTLASFFDWLKLPQAWVGGFDLPFGLPRELVEHLQWPTDWLPCMQHYTALSRADIRATFKAFCDARPVGGKFAHRVTDTPAGSSPSMKWVNPPVAYMLHAGVPLLIDAGITLPRLHMPLSSTPLRIGLEAYPGLLAREQLGRRSYKGDHPAARHDPTRRAARATLIDALLAGQTRLGLGLQLDDRQQRDELLADASGDLLDATLCLLQAGWAALRPPRYGLPADLDPLEGWIVSA